MAVALGTRAYTGTQPIGGGEGYVSQYDQAHAHETAGSLDDLNKLLKEFKGEKEIWLPPEVKFEVKTVASPAKRMILPYPVQEGVILASDRGVNGSEGALIHVTGTCSGAFATGIWFKAHTKLAGLQIQGPTNLGTKGSVGGCYTMFALKLSGAPAVEIENCKLWDFPQGLISLDNVLSTPSESLAWNSPNRVWLHHSELFGAQAHGWGYGVLESNSNGRDLACLIEACKVHDCRHLVACDHGSPFNYELRYNDFGDAWYWSANRVGGTKYYACQIDAHGSGHTLSGYAGKHYEIWANDFSLNGNKANIGIRGNPSGEDRIHDNWTKKTRNGVTGLYPAEGYEHEFIGGCFVDLEGSEGGPWSSTPCSRCSSSTYRHLDEHRVWVWNNWYGPTPPPDDDEEEPEPQPNGPDIKVVNLEAPEVELGDLYTIRATVLNEGDAPGDSNIEIGWITASGSKRKLRTIPVTLQPGESKVVEHQATSISIGDWKFYCGGLTVILSVVEKPPAVPVIELGAVSVGVLDGKVDIVATVTNSGNADGKAVVKLGGDVSASKEVAVAAGASQEVAFNMTVELDDAG